MLILSLFLSIYGCAMQATEQQNHDRKDSIIAYIEACEAAGNHIVYTGPATSSASTLRGRVKGRTVSRHDTLSDFTCHSDIY